VANFRDRQLPRDDSAAFRAADRKTHRRSQIEQVCTDQVSEGLQLELKSDLPTSEFARNQLGEEVAAFANTMGGVVLIGIEESPDHPHRATKPRPLPSITITTVMLGFMIGTETSSGCARYHRPAPATP
jgi:hypothetical protein